MNADDFVFNLPEELIAAYPAEKRDGSRLMVLPHGDENAPIHTEFSSILQWLRPGDLLVRNNSRVIAARLFAQRASGGMSEMLLLEPQPRPGDQRPTWRAMMKPARKARPGDRMVVAPGSLELEVLEAYDNGERLLAFETYGATLESRLAQHGHIPLPPYIMKRRKDMTHQSSDTLDNDDDRVRYQTVYAKDEGSIAAPTAGLHFTEELLTKAQNLGVTIADVTLHVGAGTFVSMEEGTKVEDHVMHKEIYTIPDETARLVTEAKSEGRRVIAIGTTSVRTLEAAWDRENNQLPAGSSDTKIMIKPGYPWSVVDCMVTNFHLPRSTLMLLVSSFIGKERILAAYDEAIKERYRFFSYGDAMLLHRA